MVNDDKGVVVSVQNESRPLSGDFSKQVAVNPLQQTSPMLGPQPIPLSQLPNSPYNNAPGNRMSMPGQSMSQPMLGQGQMMGNQMGPGMPQQPVGGPMMNPGMQPMGQMGQMGQNQPMMNPGMMGNQMNPGMGQNPAMMNSPGQSPVMQRPMGQNPGMMGNQMGPGMPQSPMMGQNYNQPNMASPMQSPMMSHQPMNTGTYQMAPQANNPMMMGQGQPMTGGQNYRLSQQYSQPIGTQNTMGMTQPMMPQMGQGTMNPQMGSPMMGQGTMNPQMGTQMGQMTGQGMSSTQTPGGWPPGYAPPPPNNAGQYGNPSMYNQYSSPSQSPSLSQYTPSATNPFAQQVGQAGQPQYGYNPQNTGQYNPQQPQSPSQYGNTAYGQQPGQYQPTPGTYGTSNQMYNYRQ